MVLFGRALEVKGLYWWVVPWYKELPPVSKTIREEIPREWIVKASIRDNVYRYILLPNGSEIYFHSADTPDTLRGSGLTGVVCEEAAQIHPDRWTHELRPSLMDSGGWAMFISTPKGRNWFYHLYLRGQGDDPSWKSWMMPTSTNPYILEEELANAKSDMTELVYRQEILAEFLEGEGTVFRKIDTARTGTLALRKDRKFSVGIDLAKTQDWTVLTAMDHKGIVWGWERFNQVDWTFQKDRIRAFVKAYPGRVYIDSTGVGDPIYDDLYNEGMDIVSYKFTNESKKTLIENLIIGFDRERYVLPRDAECDVLANELKAFTYKMLPSGKIRYEAPPGMTDDCVIGLGLSAWGIREGGVIVGRPAILFGRR